MSGLHSIPIRIEHAPSPDDAVIVRAVLTEIQALLERLLTEGEGGTIDLRSLPAITPASLELLEQWLPLGEISAVVSGVGRTEVRETAYPGVWWVVHRNARGDLVTEQIQVAVVPEIIPSQEVDIAAGLKRLTSVLAKVDRALEESEKPAGT